MKKTSLRGSWYGYLPFGTPKRLRVVRQLLWDGVAKGIEESVKTSGDLPMKDAALHATCVADYLRRATDENGDKLPEDLMLSNCVIMIGAGFVTTSSLLAWLIYALTKYPGNQQRLLQELIDQGASPEKEWSYDELMGMPFLDKFVKETQRMHNPSFQTARNAREDVVLPGGYFLPKGAVIIPTFPSLHKNPQHWDNPTRFDPDRWDTEEVRGRHKMAYTPFAAGTRGCVGYNLALLEVKSVMAKLVYRYHFHDASTEAVVYDPEFIVVRPLNFYARAVKRTKWPERQFKQVCNQSIMATTATTATAGNAGIRSAAQSSVTTTTQLSVFDLIPPRVYIKFIVYLPLQHNVSFQQAFAHLQAGVRGMLRQFPFLDGRIFPRDEGAPGWRPGHIVVSYNSPCDERNAEPPRQLAFKDLSQVLPPFEDLRDSGFEFSAFDDELVLAAPFVPDLSGGADVFLAQANLVEGGCILATGFHHSASDATGMVTAMRAWAEHCRNLDRPGAADVCSWLAPESFDRTLLERLWSQRPANPFSQIPRDTWGYLGFEPPDAGTHSDTVAAPQPPAVPARTMESSIFYMSPENFTKLKHEVLGDGNDGSGLSANDALLALFWRALMKARHRAAIAAGTPTPEDEISHLESPVDGRPDFDPALPASYAGNLVIVNKVPMPVSQLAAPTTSLRDIALRIRAQASKVNPDLVRDAFALMREVPDYTKLKHAFTKLDGFDVMITSVLLLPLDQIAFGADVFGNGGRPESLRPLMDAFNANFRLCMVLPMKGHGGIELLVSLFDDEMAQLLEDEEFARFAAFCCH
ncbi:cytochrome P450 82A2 [Colletotrichum musicola]|uniref:Cytochrome P450 82A2 n=1 Tax=Colletotrichum musicola TaxID=2175873 RepID=A0A8H6J1K7_9PEZI|nr:cytochrome P450 82A2 [Colletotrichum musicola]